ncbi:MAG: M48 family metallopeptidase [Pseudomonadaceae bacterium]
MRSMLASPSVDLLVSGRFFDGESSSAQAATARLQGDQLRLDLVDGSVAWFCAQDVRLGMQVGSANSYLHLGERAALESADVAGLQALAAGLNAADGGTVWLRRLELNIPLVLVSLLVVAGMLVGGVLWGVPWLSKNVAYLVPVALEQRAGEEGMATLDQFWLSPSELEEERQQALLRSMQPYLVALGERYPEHALKVHFRDGGELGANAFALPGGNLVFTDQMVALAEHDEELVAVLAHEVGHAVHRHSMRNLVQGSLLVFVMVSLTGDVSAASDLVTGVPALLATLSYRRGMEEEADDFALAFLQEQNISPQRFAAIMLRLDPPSGEEGEGDELSGFLSTHPPTPERIERFQTGH